MTTASSRRSTSLSRPLPLAAALAAAVALLLCAAPRRAHAQACCAAAGLIAPARLRSYEDVAAGVQGRARSVLGSFDERGAYVANGDGDSELDLEQDLFAVARVLRRGQVAVVVPFVETRRTIAADGSMGGGIGDLAVTARYDFIESGERSLPGIAVLAGLLLPTGAPPDRGQGSYEGSLGLGLEQAFEPYFLSGAALCALRSPRSVAGVHESFAPRLTGFLAAGRVLPHGATLGVFASGLWQGDNRDDRGTIAGSSVALWTAGLAGALSISDAWRAQSTVFGDLPIEGFGRNQTTGLGGSLSLIRLWL